MLGEQKKKLMIFILLVIIVLISLWVFLGFYKIISLGPPTNTSYQGF